MKKTFLSVFFAVVLVSFSFTQANDFDKTVNQLAIKLQPFTELESTKPSLAVLNFSTENNAHSFEEYLVNALFESFFATGNLKLIERSNIEKVLKEQDFQLSGYVDDETAKNIGKITGVDYVCYGSVIDLGNTIKISGKTVDVQSGEIVSVGSVRVDKTEEMENLLNPSYKGKISLTSKGYDSVQSNNWKVKTYRNDFDNMTVITLTCLGSDSDSIIIGYEKHDNTLRSKIVVGIWPPKCSGAEYNGMTYEIKQDSGEITKTTMWGNTWSETTGIMRNDVNIRYYAQKNDKRSFLDLLLNNTMLAVRGDYVVKYNVSGLSKVLSDNGITYKEISEALANEEF